MRRFFLFLALFSILATAQETEIGRSAWVSAPTPAAEALKAAKAATADGNVGRAARALQAIFDEHAGSFVKQTGRGNYYVGARQSAIQLLADSGDAVRARYVALFGTTADELLRQSLAAHDERGLRNVIRRFEGTPAGLAAIISLADRSLQRGRPAEARLLLSRIDDLHPDALDTDPSLRARVQQAESLDFTSGGPKPSGTGTSDDPALAAGLPTGLPTLRGWPMLGGDATRTRIASAIRKRRGDRVATPEAEPQYQIDVAIEERSSDEPIQPDRGFGSVRGQTHARQWQRHWEDYAPLAPVIARGRLIYSDGRRIVAVNLYTGDELWSYPPKPFEKHNGRTNISQVFSPAVVDGVVYGAIEIEVPFRPQSLQTVPIIYYIPQRRMVALDLETGQPRWSHETDALKKRPPQATAALATLLPRLSIVGVPLVRGDRIYAPASYSEGTIHTHLLSLDRHTGAPVYATPISNGQLELNLFGRQLNELVTTPIAETDGQILFGTNMGIVCALDAVLGSPQWARLYDVLPIRATFLWFEAPRRWPTFENGPPLVVGDRLIIAPTDGRSVLCLHRQSGRLIWEFRGKWNDRNFPIRRIHGTDGERVFLGGDDGVLALWINEAPSGERAGERAGEKVEPKRSGTQAWIHRFPGTEHGAGRGVVAEDGLWVPTYTSVLQLDMKTGGPLEGCFEREGSDRGERVHLSWGEGALVATTRDTITVRYQHEDVVHLADDAVARNPDSARARIAAGDVYLAVGEFVDAARRYREGLERAVRGALSNAEARARIGLHSAMLRRAFDLLGTDPDRAPTAFDAAFRNAPDKERAWNARRRLEVALGRGTGRSYAEWRLRNLRAIESQFGERKLDSAGRTVRAWALLRAAEIHVRSGDARRAVADLQKLLEQDPTSPDGPVASDAIQRILDATGRRPYEPFERRAADLFDATLKRGDLDSLERALSIYANAEAAEKTILKLANRRLQNGEAGRAAVVLQRFLLDRPSSSNVPGALQILFHCYNQRNAHGSALAALQRLRHKHPLAPLLRTDGAEVTAGAWADDWLKKEPYATLRRSAQRLDLEPPLAKLFDRKLNGRFVDLPDLLGQKPKSLRDAVLVRVESRGFALDTQSGKTLFTIDFRRLDPRGPFVVSDERILGLTSRAVYFFNSVDGKRVATLPIRRNEEGLRLHEHHGQVFVLSSATTVAIGSLRVTAIDPTSAKELWSTSIPRLPSGERHNERMVAVHDGRLVLVSSDGAHVTVLDTSSGAIETRVPLLEGSSLHPMQPMHVLPDGRILITFSVSAARSALPRNRRGPRLRSYGLALLDPSRQGDDVIQWRDLQSLEKPSRKLMQAQVCGSRVVVIEKSYNLRVLNLRDGRVLLEKPLSDLIEEHIELMDSHPRHDSLLLLLARGSGNRPPQLFAIDPKDLSLQYGLELSTEIEVRPDDVRSDGVVTVALVPNAGLRSGAGLGFQLIDPLNARRIQVLRPGVDRAKWYQAKVQNGTLLVVLGNRIVAYGPK